MFQRIDYKQLATFLIGALVGCGLDNVGRLVGL